MRVLFASTQGAGHFNPLVPFAHAFRRAGHELVVVGPPVLAERAEAAGLPFRPGRRPPEDVLGRVWEQVPRLPPAQGEVAVVGTIFARLNVEAMLPAHRAAMADWQPDLVVREPSEFASAVAAEEHGIRHVRVGIGLALVEQGAVAFAAPALEDWRPGLVGRIDASPYLTCLPESLDPAPWPVRRFRDPALDAPAQPLADW